MAKTLQSGVIPVTRYNRSYIMPRHSVSIVNGPHTFACEASEDCRPALAILQPLRCHAQSDWVRVDFTMTISMLVVDDEETDVIRFKRAARKAGCTEAHRDLQGRRRSVWASRSSSRALNIRPGLSASLRPQDAGHERNRARGSTSRRTRSCRTPRVYSVVIGLDFGHRRCSLQRSERLHFEMRIRGGLFGCRPLARGLLLPD